MIYQLSIYVAIKDHFVFTCNHSNFDIRLDAMCCSYDPFFINDGTSTEAFDFTLQKNLQKQNCESYYRISVPCVLVIEWVKSWLLAAGRTVVFLESVSFADELVLLEHNQQSHFCNYVEEKMQ